MAPKKEQPLAADIHIKVHPELRALLEEEAGEEKTFSDVIAPIIARHFKRPDLAETPRKRMGRPRKETVTA